VVTGDHVMGWNTTVIAPPEGNMAKFLASLEKLLPRHDKVFLPAHGGRVQTPQRVVRAYIMHRQWREQTILACLEDGVSTIPRIVSKIYGALDADLKAAAALSVLAHLDYMISRGLVTVDCRTVHDAAEPQAAGSLADLSRVYSVSAGASSPAS
jgi:glyoxylase-like metal-dependent hydrolase (beta-lactamase superfamily II)